MIPAGGGRVLVRRSTSDGFQDQNSGEVLLCFFRLELNLFAKFKRRQLFAGESDGVEMVLRLKFTVLQAH